MQKIHAVCSKIHKIENLTYYTSIPENLEYIYEDILREEYTVKHIDEVCELVHYEREGVITKNDKPVMRIYSYYNYGDNYYFNLNSNVRYVNPYELEITFHFNYYAFYVLPTIVIAGSVLIILTVIIFDIRKIKRDCISVNEKVD